MTTIKPGLKHRPEPSSTKVFKANLSLISFKVYEPFLAIMNSPVWADGWSDACQK